MTPEEEAVLAEAMSVLQEEQEIMNTEDSESPQPIVEIVPGGVLNATLWEYPDSEWVSAADYLRLADEYIKWIDVFERRQDKYNALRINHTALVRKYNALIAADNPKQANIASKVVQPGKKQHWVLTLLQDLGK